MNDDTDGTEGNYTLDDVKQYTAKAFERPLSDRGVRGLFSALMSLHPSIQYSTLFVWTTILQQQTDQGIAAQNKLKMKASPARVTASPSQKTASNLVAVDSNGSSTASDATDKPAASPASPLSSVPGDFRASLNLSVALSPQTLLLEGGGERDRPKLSPLREPVRLLSLSSSSDEEDENEEEDGGEDGVRGRRGAAPAGKVSLESYIALEFLDDDDNAEEVQPAEPTAPPTESTSIAATAAEVDAPHADAPSSTPSRSSKGLFRDRKKQRGGLAADCYPSYLVLSVETDPVPALCHPAVFTTVLDRLAQMGYSLLHALTGQVVTDEEEVVEEYEERVFEACVEMLLRLFAPRLPAIHALLAPHMSEGASKTTVPSVEAPPQRAQTSYVFVNSWRARPSLFISPCASLLQAVTLHLYPDMYSLFAAVDQMLCLVHTAVEEYLRLTTLLRGMYAWYVVEEASAHPVPPQAWLKRHKPPRAPPLSALHEQDKLQYPHMRSTRKYAVGAVPRDRLRGWGVVLDAASCDALTGDKLHKPSKYALHYLASVRGELTVLN